MADLTDVLPNFDLQPWRHLTFSLEKKNILTAELVSQDPLEIARKCPLPLKEVKRFAAAVNAALQADVRRHNPLLPIRPQDADHEPARKKQRKDDTPDTTKKMCFVRTLDDNIDQCLGGGFPTGSICEIVGESAVGKTQFVLSLLLSAQLPAPGGLGKPVMYLSTEDPLNTSRLLQILSNHPEYQNLPEAARPSLDRIYTVSTRNFDQQENIIQYKLPFLVEQYNIGLVVIDSVAANFRIQFPGAAPAMLARRAKALAQLGNVLRRIAHDHAVAVVVTNQVADRFEESRVDPDKFRFSSSLPSSSATMSQHPETKSTQTSMGPPNAKPISLTQAAKDEIMSLDYQQCFFTGWGSDLDKPYEAQKNPVLGLAWANQLNARVVLKIAHDSRPTATENIYSDQKRRRHLSVVFAPWAPPTATPVEYELQAHGLVSIPLPDNQTYAKAEDYDDFDDGSYEVPVLNKGDDVEIQEMLDPKYWEDGLSGDDEFL